jgi:hypothetical protein
MKHLFFLAIMSLSSVSMAAADWKVVAETTSCAEKIQIMGKEGEKYVMAVRGEEKTKLFAKDGSEFHENTMRPVEYSAKAGEVSYNYYQPSYVEGNPPKIDVAFNGAKKRCKMDLSK